MHILHVLFTALVLVYVLYPLQNGDTALRYAAMYGHATCMERLLSVPDIGINTQNPVGWPGIEC